MPEASEEFVSSGTQDFQLRPFYVWPRRNDSGGLTHELRFRIQDANYLTLTGGRGSTAINGGTLRLHDLVLVIRTDKNNNVKTTNLSWRTTGALGAEGDIKPGEPWNKKAQEAARRLRQQTGGEIEMQNVGPAQAEGSVPAPGNNPVPAEQASKVSTALKEYGKGGNFELGIAGGFNNSYNFSAMINDNEKWLMPEVLGAEFLGFLLGGAAGGYGATFGLAEASPAAGVAAAHGAGTVATTGVDELLSTTGPTKKYARSRIGSFWWGAVKSRKPIESGKGKAGVRNRLQFNQTFASKILHSGERSIGDKDDRSN